MLRIATLLAASALLIVGCSSTPPLESKSAANTGLVDLSGDWALRGGEKASRPPVADGDQPIWIPKRTSQRQQQQRQPRQQRPRRSDATAVGVFLETGRAISITQTEHGLFISFDRAVVEEYTFGENRLVSVGPIEAQRVSGWEGNAFVVETLDEDGARLRESWSLMNGGEELVRRIAVTRGETEEFSMEQLFDRN
ncbi:MAG: hypothetical protein QNJ11_09015 [Woeseiaceae bacterium]|nr:hypothetical protein [Woeseiaceae bacterium]